ncbi:hypothetical protein TESG_03604 [Trichophyton tonsurans CBS 112818]|uniref:Uncharacterized protein n=1 Tax=Trichophyton tonsurans (strain CBS 112818) TaxID=647933 RepID=F2RXV1_TRIT1|nr:hypothetical protein TESG_03604 [Trichophyton tonsurans CBS 112818]
MMDRRLRFRQHETDCESGIQFYACSKGAYRGCCSVDPCDTGICPDDLKIGNKRSSSTTSTSRTLRPTPTSPRTTFPSTNTASSTTDTEFTTPLPPPGIPPSSPMIPTESTTSTFKSSTSTSSPSLIPATGIVTLPIPEATILHSGPSRGAFIGGIVGTVVIALLLFIGAFFWFHIRRKRKKAGKWRGSCAVLLCRRQKETTESITSPTVEKAPEPEPCGEPCGELDGSKYRAEMFAPSEGSSFAGSPRTYVDSPSIGSSTTITPSTHSIAWSNEKIVSPGTNSAPLRGLGTYSAVRPGSSIPTISELPATTNPPQPPVPRELEGSSTAESSPHKSLLSPTSRQVSQGVKLTVTTPEGVVLRPNLHDSPAQQHPQCQELETLPHVMSFMDYPDKPHKRDEPSS